MPLNRLEIFADKLRPLLEVGESARFLGAATYIPGDEQLGPDRPRFDADLHLLDLALGLPIPVLQRKVDEFLVGHSLVGERGCQAEALSKILTGIPDLLVTDRRLLVVAHEGQEFRTVWQAPRDAILAASPAPRFGQMGRVRLVLSDGSGIAVVLGLVLPGRARRFLAALQPIAGELR
jgi:hypothetical protein